MQQTQTTPTVAQIAKALAALDRSPADGKLKALLAPVAEGGDLYASAGRLLQGAREAAVAQQADLEAALREHEAELQACGATAAEAAAAVAKATETAAHAAEAAEASKAAVGIAEREHANAERRNKAWMKSYASTRAAHDKALALAGGPLNSLLAGSSCEDDAVGAIVQWLREAGAEEALVAAAPHALGCAQHARHAFDTSVVEAVQSVLSQHLTVLQSEAEDAIREEAALKAEMLGLWAIADTCRDEAADVEKRAAEAAQGLRSAEAALRKAQGGVQKQQGFIEEQHSNIAAAGLEVQAAESAQALIEKLVSKQQEQAKEEVATAMEVAGETGVAEAASQAQVVPQAMEEEVATAMEVSGEIDVAQAEPTEV